MTQEEILFKIIQWFEQNGVDYFITGSFASNVHGVPRATRDADIVVKGSLNQFLKMSRDLSQEFYLSESAIREAMARGSLFNLIHLEEGFKFDLIPTQGSSFDQSRFARRLKVTLQGLHIYFSSAEDIILAKLWWAAQSNSEMQLKDVSDIIELQGSKLDWTYLRTWAKTLNVASLLQKISP